MDEFSAVEMLINNSLLALLPSYHFGFQGKKHFFLQVICTLVISFLQNLLKNNFVVKVKMHILT